VLAAPVADELQLEESRGHVLDPNRGEG
jgi:hypothetical protein